LGLACAISSIGIAHARDLCICAHHFCPLPLACQPALAKALLMAIFNLANEAFQSEVRRKQTPNERKRLAESH
jgi:hypothetical protein